MAAPPCLSPGRHLPKGLFRARNRGARLASPERGACDSAFPTERSGQRSSRSGWGCLTERAAPARVEPGPGEPVAPGPAQGARPEAQPVGALSAGWAACSGARRSRSWLRASSWASSPAAASWRRTSSTSARAPARHRLPVRSSSCWPARGPARWSGTFPRARSCWRPAERPTAPGCRSTSRAPRSRAPGLPLHSSTPDRPRRASRSRRAQHRRRHPQLQRWSSPQARRPRPPHARRPHRRPPRRRQRSRPPSPLLGRRRNRLRSRHPSQLRSRHQQMSHLQALSASMASNFPGIRIRRALRFSSMFARAILTGRSRASRSTTSHTLDHLRRSASSKSR